MVRFAPRMALLGKESAFVVLDKAQALERQGRSIIHLEIGDTDFGTPASIIEEAFARARAGDTHYCASAGLLELRRACCRFLSRDGRGDYRPEEIVIGPGGKPFLYYTIMAFAGAGDEVIYPDPGFPVYQSVAAYSGARPVPLPIVEENDFRFGADDLQRRVSANTRLLILNYPHNPTGGTLDRGDLEAIAAIAVSNDLVVLSDEVYAHMLFEGEHISLATLPGMRERTVTLESCSKTYAMTGWRLGFVAAPVEIAETLTRMITNSVSCVPPFIQLAAAAAMLGDQSESEAMMADFKRRRGLFVDGLNRIPGITCRLPRGAFYAFPNVSALPLSAEDLADHLLDQAGVATLPGSAFGSHASGHLRMCFANSTENLKEALRRIEQAVRELG